MKENVDSWVSHQKFHDTCPAVLAGDKEGAVTGASREARVDSWVLQQPSHDLRVTLLTGFVEWAGQVSLLLVHLDSGVGQHQVDDLEVALLAGNIEGRGQTHIALIRNDVGVGQQLSHNWGPSKPARAVEWGIKTIWLAGSLIHIYARKSQTGFHQGEVPIRGGQPQLMPLRH